MKRLFALIALTLTLFTFGCGTLDPSGVYQGDALLYRTEAVIPTAYSMLHEFVKFEHENRASLPPEVTAAADHIRVNAKGWFTAAFALRDAYAADPSPENRQALENQLKTLRGALTTATQMLATYR